jgi:uncharacterized membrane protein
VRLVAFALNLALACYVLYMLITAGASQEDILLVSIFLAAPISALLALFMRGGESWKRIEKMEITSQ